MNFSRNPYPAWQQDGYELLPISFNVITTVNVVSVINVISVTFFIAYSEVSELF
jgi:hypothetical protein